MSPLRYLLSLIGVSLLLSCFGPRAFAQSTLSTPDFSGMYAPVAYIQTFARDSERGWNYLRLFGGTDSPYFVNGVQTRALVRVSDSGQLDHDWIVAGDAPIRSPIVLSGGDLLVRTDIFSSILQRLERGPDGAYRPQRFEWTRDPVFQGFDTAPIARDPQGNFYTVFFAIGPEGTLSPTLRRISAAGTPDANWRLDIEGGSGAITHLAVGVDGSVIYVTTRTDASAPEGSVRTIHRTSARDSLRWSQPVSGALAAVTVDDAGRAYLLGSELVSQGHRGNLLRFSATGTLDTQWSPALDISGATVASAALAIVNKVLVVVAPRTDAFTGPRATLVSLSDANALVSRTVDSAYAATIAGNDATVVANGATGITLLTPTQTGFTERFVPLTVGTAPRIAAVAKWGNTYLIGGQFEYWYEGIRYTNLMRLTTDLKPDPSWQPGITGVVTALAIDRDGGVVVGGEHLLDAQSSLLRFTSEGRLDPLWRQPFDGPVLTVTAADDGTVFAGGYFGAVGGIRRSSIVRFRADGSIDAGWAVDTPWQAPPAPFGGDRVTKIVDAAAGGVLGLSEDFGFSNSYNPTINRLSRTANGAVVPLSTALESIIPSSLAQDPVTGRLFGTQLIFGTASQQSRRQLVRLLPGTLEIDPTWIAVPIDPDVVAFGKDYMYLANGRRLLRTANSVAPVPNWTLRAADVAGWIDTSATDGLTWPMRGAPIAVRSPTQDITQRTVIEYFANDIQRFFITARPAEQQQLDATPARFTRTGMQFGAFDGTVVAPDSGSVAEAGLPQPPFSAAGAVPICRFFASPTRGGSNTHFYGRRTDCQILNTVKGLTNEGHDFAAQPPIAGVCPAHAPNPVFRLVNNKSASNNGNHRYVVAVARVNEMKALGWLDEGIAFCAISATDSRAFGQW